MPQHLFGVPYRFTTETVADLYPSSLHVDLSVQRDLSKSRARQIARYVIRAVGRDTIGAFFAPLVASERTDGRCYLIDGQHRWNGIVLAIEGTKREIEQAESALSETGLDVHTRSQLNEVLTHQRLILKGLERSEVPIMVYTGLTQAEERQLFHDLNNLSRKAPLSLSLQYNSSDPFIQVTKEAVIMVPGLTDLVEHSRGPNRVGTDKLFLFSTVYKALYRLLGKHAFSSPSEEDDLYRANLETAIRFLNIVVISLPEDKLKDTYLYRDAKVLQGIAEFARQMRELPRVDWAVTLAEVLATFRFDHRNHLFVTVGQASKNNQGHIVFRGTGSGVTAVARTLASQARRLDSRGEEVDDAYGRPLVDVDEQDFEPPLVEFDTSEDLIALLPERPAVKLNAGPRSAGKEASASRKIRDEDIQKVLQDSH